MAKITLDADTFRALASSTRLTVLKALGERRKTLTELARDLDLNKATVHEHMALLTAAGLVKKRDDEGRKWIYYELTWTGQRILHPEATTTFNLLLGLSVAAAGGGVAMLGRAMGWWLDNTLADRGSDGADQVQPFGLAQDESAQDTGMAASSASQTSSSASSSSSASPAAGSAPVEDTTNQQALKSGATNPPDHGDAGGHFFDDGGWIALALLMVCVLFLALAWFMQRRLVSKPLDEAAALAAEKGSG